MQKPLSSETEQQYEQRQAEMIAEAEREYRRLVLDEGPDYSPIYDSIEEEAE